MKKSSIAPFACALLIFAMVSPAFGAPILSPFDLGAGKPYTIIQLGDPPEINPQLDDDQLNIESNSSVFGSVLKGEDTKPSPDFPTFLSTSKVTKQWDIETGVTRDKTSSSTGSENTLTSAQMDQIYNDATDASTFWAGQAATDLTAAQHSALNAPPGGGVLTLTGTTSGANVFNSTENFIVASDNMVDRTILELTGGPGDFFVFNIAPNQAFMIDGAEIRLGGDIVPEEVLFNVLGSVGGGFFDDAQIQEDSLFRGTLLAPGRNVIVAQNHFITFASSGFPDDDGGMQAPSTTAVVWDDPTNTAGLFGQIVAGGKINWSESDIAYHGFMTMPVPEPATLLLFGTGLVGIGVGNRRRRRKES